MKFLFLVLSLIFITISKSLSANNSIDTNANFVIAKSGLKLRSSPSIKGEVLALLTFGSRVKYLSELSFGITKIDLENQVANVGTVDGHWVKVKYKNIIGFVLDAYLYYNKEKNLYYSDLVNRDYLIIRPGCGCNEHNFYNPKDWNFKALIEDDNGMLWFQPADINYIRTRNYTCDLLVYTSVKHFSKIKYIVAEKGSKTILSSKKVFFKALNFDNTTTKYDVDKSTQFTISYKPKMDIDGLNREIQEIELVNYYKKQILSLHNLSVFSIDIISDLDQDGIMDYIIDLSSEVGFISLYLSSQNKDKNKMVKEGARFYHQYCC